MALGKRFFFAFGAIFSLGEALDDLSTKRVVGGSAIRGRNKKVVCQNPEQKKISFLFHAARDHRLGYLAAFSFYKKRHSEGRRPILTCTGTLISSSWVVSASHCLGPKEALGPDRCVPRGNQCLRNPLGDFEYRPVEVDSEVISNYHLSISQILMVHGGVKHKLCPKMLLTSHFLAV